MIYRCDLIPQYRAYKREIGNALNRVLNSGRYTLSDEVRTFENKFADYLKVKFSIGVASGTDALILALKSLGIGKGDEVITTPYTAIPTCSAIIAVGAKPVFLDIDEKTYLIDINGLQSVISNKTKAIIPVHIFGNVVDIRKIKKIVRGRIPIIEDACQAHGSKINGNYAGSMGTLSAFSFYPTKNLGSYGDGGVVATSSGKHDRKIRLLRMYGMRDKDHIIVNGLNSRLDELQAAILRVKLKHLEDMNRKRQVIANYYVQSLRKDLFEHQYIENNVFCNYHVFASRFKDNREKFTQYMDKKNIQTNIYYPVPLHLQKANKFLGYRKGDFPKTEKLCQQAIALPMYPELSHKTQNLIIKTINDFS